MHKTLARSLSVLALASVFACGGRVDTGAAGGDVTAPERAPNPSAPVATAPSSGPERVAEGVGEPSALALAADRVVFTTRATVMGGERVEAGALFVRDKDVGPALMIAVDRQGASYDALALDDDSAFVATSDARIVQVPLSGGEARVVATLDEAAWLLSSAGDDVVFATEAGRVGRVKKSGGAPEALADLGRAVRGLVAADGAVFVATADDEAKGEPGGIVRVDLGTGEATALAQAGAPCAMTKAGAHLVWTSSASEGGAVLALPLEGGDVAKLAETSLSACAIAADATSLYFATTSPDALPVRSRGAAVGLGLMRAPISGGRPAMVADAADALVSPGAVAVDATHLYWLTRSGVLRLRK